MLARFLTILTFALFLPSAPALADDYRETIDVFKAAGESGRFFKDAYGYAVFPTIGKGGVGLGGAYGTGHVYEKGNYIGDTTMIQASVGWQLGGQAYSQIIFFKDAHALDDFKSGNFEFGAEASAVAITAGIGAQATTTGASVAASGGRHDAVTSGSYYKGMAIFTVAKGGLMYQATIGGQKFNYASR
jgi:lipid-binding SYLF domain-containing protein